MTKHEYVRNYHGDVIHKVGCGKIGKRCYPWDWAEGRSEDELRKYLDEAWLRYKFCKACFGDPDRDETERQLLRRQLELEQQE